MLFSSCLDPVIYHNPEENDLPLQSVTLRDDPSIVNGSANAALIPRQPLSNQLVTDDLESDQNDLISPSDGSSSFVERLGQRIFPNPVIFMWFVSAFAAISGFLFGYDIGIIAGALLMMREAFQMTQGQEEAVVSLVLVGSIAGSLGAGIMNDKLGRWRSILISNVAFLLGSAVITFSPLSTLAFVYIGRLIVGLAIGVLPLTSTLYIAELSQPKRRGTMVRKIKSFSMIFLSSLLLT